MSTIDPKRLGFAMASISALLYLACALVMEILPQDVAIRFFNSLAHGADLAPIMRFDVPWYEMLLGTVEMFVLGWLTGFALALAYNLNTGGKTV